MDKINMVSKNDLYSWVARALEKENLLKYTVDLEGATSNCDGYAGDIVFLKVIGTDTKGEEKIFSLVVKHNKDNEYLKHSAWGVMFSAEIQFYDKVYPLMENFQLGKKVNGIFNSVPKCLKTLKINNKEVLILENLKTQGYELHERRKPWNTFHIKAVFEQIGKLHAVSFALREQRGEEFDAVLRNYPNFFDTFLNNELSTGCFKKALDNALKSLLDHGEIYLVEKLKTLVSGNTDSVVEVMNKMLEVDKAQSVFIHGDGWNNNFMFKYKGTNRTSPNEVVLLDWQLSYIRSPAVDLAYILYSTASAEELKHFDELLEYYYESFSNFLRALGSNPEELFPFSALKEHWRKCSTFGVLYSSYQLTMVLCDEENAPAFGDLKCEKDLEKFLVVDISKNEIFYERYRDVVRYYFNYTSK